MTSTKSMEKTTSLKNLRSILGLRDSKSSEDSGVDTKGNTSSSPGPKKKEALIVTEMRAAPLKISEPILVRTTSTRFSHPAVQPAPPVDRRPSVTHSPAPPKGPSPHVRRQLLDASASLPMGESQPSTNSLTAEPLRSSSSPAQLAAALKPVEKRASEPAAAEALTIARATIDGKRFSQLASHATVTGISPEELTRQDILHELITTEQLYIANLTIIIKEVLQPIRANNLLTVPLSVQIFLNLESLLETNKELLNDLEKERRKSSMLVGNIGAIFVRRSNLFKVYAHYCAHHSSAMQRLDETRKKDPALEAFLQGVRTRLRSVESMLILPVQRLYKYPLFLENLLQSTPRGHPDHLTVIAALDKVKEVATLVDERAQQVQRMEEIREIADLLSKDDPNWIDLQQRHRVLLADVRVTQQSTLLGTLAGRKKARVLLFNDLLLVTRVHKEKLKILWHSALDAVMVRMLITGQAEIAYFGGSEFWTFKSEADRKRWTKQLQHARRRVLLDQAAAETKESTAPHADAGATQWQSYAEKLEAQLAAAQAELAAARVECKRIDLLWRSGVAPTAPVLRLDSSGSSGQSLANSQANSRHPSVSAPLVPALPSAGLLSESDVQTTFSQSGETPLSLSARTANPSPRKSHRTPRSSKKNRALVPADQPSSLSAPSTLSHPVSAVKDAAAAPPLPAPLNCVAPSLRESDSSPLDPSIRAHSIESIPQPGLLSALAPGVSYSTPHEPVAPAKAAPPSSSDSAVQAAFSSASSTIPVSADPSPSGPSQSAVIISEHSTIESDSRTLTSHAAPQQAAPSLLENVSSPPAVGGLPHASRAPSTELASLAASGPGAPRQPSVSQPLHNKSNEVLTAEQNSALRSRIGYFESLRPKKDSIVPTRTSGKRLSSVEKQN